MLALATSTPTSITVVATKILWAHPVDLGAFCQLHPQAVDQSLDGVDGEGFGDDRLAARRLLRELGDVEVAVVRHEQRARDRRCGHDENPSPAARGAWSSLGLQGETLMHAKAVLFVNHGKSQVLEVHIRLKQGMCANEDVDRPGREPLQQLRARATLLAAGEQGKPQASRLGERSDGVGVLPRQDLRRRHERGLCPCLNGDGHGHQGHHRFAGTDIALQQPQHAVWRRHVPGDLLERLALRGREAEGKGAGDTGADAAIANDLSAGLGSEALAHQG